MTVGIPVFALKGVVISISNEVTLAGADLSLSKNARNISTWSSL